MMKKVYTTLCFCIIACNLVHTQTTQSFLHLFLDSYQPPGDMNVKVLPRTDKKLAIFGTAYIDTIPQASRANTFSLMDTNGNFIWAKHLYYNLSSLNYFRDFCIAQNDTFFELNYNSAGQYFLSKLSPDGQHVDAKQLSYNFSAIRTDGTNLYLIGTNEVTQFGLGAYEGNYVAKLNPDLTVNWTRALTDTAAELPSGHTFYDGTVTHDNYLILCGNAFKNGNEQYSRIVKLDLSGNRIWEKNINAENAQNNAAFKVVEINGSYYVTGGVNGSLYYMKLNAAGNIVWTKKMVSVTGNISDMSAISDHEFTIYLNTGQQDYIYCMDTTGNVKYISKLGNPIRSNTSGNVLKVGNNIYATGRWGLPSADPDFLLGDARLFLAKGNSHGVFSCFNTSFPSVTIQNIAPVVQSITSQIDSSLSPIVGSANNYRVYTLNNYADTLFCNDQISIDSAYTINQIILTSIAEQTNSNNIELYPNPASSLLDIKVDHLTNEKLSIQLFDLSGRELKLLELTSDKISIDISDIPQGLYFVALKHSGIIETKKIVISR